MQLLDKVQTMSIVWPKMRRQYVLTTEDMSTDGCNGLRAWIPETQPAVEGEGSGLFG